MSSKARHSPSASSPSHGSKLPKFLQSKQTRDRSKSMIDPASGGSVSSSSSSPISNPLSESLSESSSSSQATPMHKNHNHINRPLARRGSKLSGVREERRQSSSSQPPTQDADISEDYSMADEGNTSMDEPPVIIEPVTPHSPRPRTRSERPLSSMSDSQSSFAYYQSSHSSSRITDLPNRLSGWFHHTFNTSSSDLTLPSLLSSSHVPSSPSATNSPKGKGSALLTAAAPATPPRTHHVPAELPDAPRARCTILPSRYICLLQTGAGSTTGLPRALPMPLGLQCERRPLDFNAPGSESDGDDAALFSEAISGGVNDDDLDDVFVRLSEDGVEWAMATVSTDSREPRTVNEVRAGAEWPKWEEAIEDELARMEKMGTWKLVEKPDCVNIVGSKWVFKIKCDAAGAIIKYKARLMAQGFSQIPGVDFTDTFALVAKLSSIRILVVLAARFNWELHQMDVKNAYLNGDLDEEIYMKQPPGFPAPGQEHKVCALFKPIYGLKQAGRRWYKKLCAAFLGMGFTRSSVDHSVFFRHGAGSEIVLITVSVDDLTIAATSVNAITDVKDALNARFEMTDLGKMHWLLGIKIKHDRGGGGRSRCRSPLDTALDPSFQLTTAQSPSTPQQYEEMCNVPYREAIGSLMYAALGTRPDIVYAVTTLSQFMQNPGRMHWEGTKRVLHYLKATKEEWLTYGGDAKTGIMGYSDTDWGSSDHRHSISGYVFLVDGRAVSWSSKKQPIVALSSTEAEYVVMTHATKEAVWMQAFLGEMLTPFDMPTPLHCDNQSAMMLAKDNIFHLRTKHIAIRYHFIRDVIERDEIDLVYSPHC
ncbi:hypothetical protein EWM64_g4908 [Hericium alpestre]|uniref:Reverse transcriptase Ty1/copia-type domain-containing protein n=1 Tax=Hericium alpestre TaxID=135208 RepID=A0A4Z0A072_9AGAM|nr:hypothetical protein EWM64_g4908 [Hericium alpestre]